MCKSVIGKTSKKGATGMQCCRCHGYAHVAAQCPSRNHLVEDADLDDDEFEKNVRNLGFLEREPVRSASDTDENVRLSRIQLSVARCLYNTSRDEDWHRSGMLYTYIAHEGKSYKLIIDREVVSILSPRQLLKRWVSKLNPAHYHTILLGSTKPLNLLLNVVECLLN